MVSAPMPADLDCSAMETTVLVVTPLDDLGVDDIDWVEPGGCRDADMTAEIGQRDKEERPCQSSCF